MTLIMPIHFKPKKMFKPTGIGKVRDQNVSFESDTTSSMSEKIQTEQSLLSLKLYLILIFSASHSFCNIFGQRLFCCYKKFFNW